MKRILFLLTLAAFLLVGCKAHYTQDAWARDTIFSVEIQRNESCRIWLTHDDGSTYCTTDMALCNLAKSLLIEHDGDVLIHFFDINWYDDQAGHILEFSACGQGIYETKVWGFDSIQPLETE